MTTDKLAALDAGYSNLDLFLASYTEHHDLDPLTDVIGLDDELLTIGALRRINAYRTCDLVPRAELDEAVAAERERCAEIAQHHPSRFTGAGGWDKQDEGFCAACIDISDTIREGNHEHD